MTPLVFKCAQCGAIVTIDEEYVTVQRLTPDARFCELCEESENEN